MNNEKYWEFFYNSFSPKETLLFWHNSMFNFPTLRYWMKDTIGAQMTTLICTKTWGTCRKAVALLKEKNIEFSYREYKKNPLQLTELKELIKLYGKPAHTLLRTREKAFKALELKGNENDETLLPLFAEYPGLMQRPLFIHQNKVVLCRPFDRLLEIL